MPAVSPARSRWARLRALAGEDAAAALVQKLGGRNLVIPATVRTDHWLTHLLGEDAMRRVVYRMAGARVYVPTQSLTAARNRLLRKESAAGASAAGLAARYGLSQRQVTRILNG